jgi:hypothetical protein
MELECLDHVGLTVADVGRSIRWYLEVPDPDGHLVEIRTYEVSTGTGRDGG